MDPSIAEWSGAITGLAGSALLAWKGPRAKYGFVAYLISNLCLILFGVQTHAWGIVTMQLGFTMTTVVGLRKWFRPEPTATTQERPGVTQVAQRQAA